MCYATALLRSIFTLFSLLGILGCQRSAVERVYLDQQFANRCLAYSSAAHFAHELHILRRGRDFNRLWSAGLDQALDARKLPAMHWMGGACADVERHLETQRVDKSAYYRDALVAFVAGLDPHSAYFPPDAWLAYEEKQKNRRDGFGLAFRLRARDFYFRLEGLAIEQAILPEVRDGVGFGDMIATLNGASPVGRTIEEVFAALNGKDDLLLEIQGKGFWRLARTPYVLPPYLYQEASGPYGRYHYLKVRNFNPGLVEQLRGVLDRSTNLGWIVDLRGNPGGSIDEAMRFAALWSEESIVVETRGQDQDEGVLRGFAVNQTRGLPGEGLHRKNPLAFLIDARSASASEMVAGALRRSKALIIGRRSFGKGTGQMPIRLSERNGLGGGLSVTMFRYYVDGDSPQEFGVTPEIVAEDAALEAWIARRRQEGSTVHYEESDWGVNVIPNGSPRGWPGSDVPSYPVRQRWDCVDAGSRRDCELEIAMRSLYELDALGYYD